MPPIASLSLDLDNKWSYLKTHGNERWRAFPSYFDLVVPRILEMLLRWKLRITFFIVGQDAALEKNGPALRAIAEAGHEIANHSFHHEPWLHLYDDAEVLAELRSADEAIATATGLRPSGFRGPGFSLSEGTLRAIKALGYAYDATSFPNILSPVGRAYFFMKSDLNREEKTKRKALFGTVRDAFKPLGPYRWETPSGPLLELPVTTMPLFRVPIHFSYVVYLGTYSPTLARFYFHSGLTLCRLTGTQPSLLLHPLDFLGADDDEDLAFFPGMNMRSDAKLTLIKELLGALADTHQVVTIREHVEAIAASHRLPLLKPVFRH